MTDVKFKPSSVGHGGYDVLVDGEVVGTVGKRTEWCGNLGHRGATYTYWDFRKPGEREKVASDSTRKAAVAQGLVALGLHDAARMVDDETARFYIAKAS